MVPPRALSMQWPIVRPETDDDTGVSLTPKLTRPQKRRRRLEKLAASRALDQVAQGKRDPFDAAGAAGSELNLGGLEQEHNRWAAVQSRLAVLESLTMDIHWHLVGQWQHTDLTGAAASFAGATRDTIPSDFNTDAAEFVPSHATEYSGVLDLEFDGSNESDPSASPNAQLTPRCGGHAYSQCGQRGSDAMCEGTDAAEVNLSDAAHVCKIGDHRHLPAYAWKSIYARFDKASHEEEEENEKMQSGLRTETSSSHVSVMQCDAPFVGDASDPQEYHCELCGCLCLRDAHGHYCANEQCNFEPTYCKRCWKGALRCQCDSPQLRTTICGNCGVDADCNCEASDKTVVDNFVGQMYECGSCFQYDRQEEIQWCARDGQGCQTSSASFMFHASCMVSVSTASMKNILLCKVCSDGGFLCDASSSSSSCDSTVPEDNGSSDKKDGGHEHTQSAWPNLTAEQQSEFKSWLSAAQAKRVDILQKALREEMEHVETAESMNQLLEARDRMVRVQALMGKLDGLEKLSSEQIRLEAWRFYETVGQK